MSQRNLSKIARAEAVTQLGSSEQLDQRLVVIPASAWVVLLVAALLTALAIAWGVLGRLPNVIQGEGVVVPKGTRPIEIFSSSAVGGVVELVVPEGAVVKVGDPIVRLRNRNLEVSLVNAKARVEILEAQDKTLTAAEDAILDRQKAWLDAQLAASQQSVDQTRKLGELYEGELTDLKELVEDKLVPRSELVQTQQAYFQVLQQISQQETVIAQANEQYSSLVTSTEQTRLARATALAEAREQVTSAETSLESTMLVSAPIDGTITEHRLNLGSSVGIGTVVASIRPHGDEGGDLVAEAFVPYGTGRRIRAGMTVRLTLPFARPSRYGYILGEVVEVSDFVVGTAAAGMIGSQALAANLSQKIGPMLRVVVRLDRDPSTPTGLRWTSSRGFPRPIEFPALCGVEVVVSEDRPIDLVVPWVKDLLGLDPPVKLLGTSPG